MESSGRKEPPRRRSDDFVPRPLPPKVTESVVVTSRELRNQLRVLIILTVLLYVGFGILTWFTWSQSNTNTKALCGIKQDAQAQVAEGRNFVKLHPNGIAGISAAQIQQSINDNIAKVNALNIVDC